MTLILLAAACCTYASGLEWGTFVGGPGFDAPLAMVSDDPGVITFAGIATTGTPTTGGAYDTTPDLLFDDGWVGRIDTSLRGPDQLVWSTVLGGDADTDWILDVAIAATGEVIVVGQTYSSDFPTTPGSYDETYNNSGDGFVAALSADGSTLIWSTFLGTFANDRIVAVDISPSGAIVVAGYTESASFPVTDGVYDVTHNGGRDIFVAQLSADGASLDWSTYIGGSGDEGFPDPLPGNPINADLMDIDIDEATGDVFLCGYTGSSDFPTTPDAWQSSNGGGFDAFALQLSAAGSLLEWSTFIGGPGEDAAISIVVDGLGRVMIGGTTWGSFPTTPGAFDTSCGTGSFQDSTIVWLDPDIPGTAQALCATCLGGLDGNSSVIGLHADDSGIVTVVGSASEGFPVTPDAFDTTYGGIQDSMVARLDMNAPGTLLYASYIGGSAAELGVGVAVDGPDDVIIVNATFSDDHPTTPGAYDETHNGDFDGAFIRFDLCPFDIDDDEMIGITDLLALLAAWGPCPGCPEDLDDDDVVGITDLLLLLAAWGSPCR